MGHQDRNGHLLEDRACRTAEHHLAQARMPVSAHDQKIAAPISHPRQKGIADADLFAPALLHLDLDAVPRQVEGNIGAGFLAMAVGAGFGIDGQPAYHSSYSTIDGVLKVDFYTSREHVLLGRQVGLLAPNELKSTLTSPVKEIK